MRAIALAVAARFLMVLILLLAMQARTHANIFGSPHDLFGQRYLLMDERKIQADVQCSLCHITPPKERPRVWDMVPASIARYGATGNQCFSCHDGVTMVDRNVDTALTVFHPGSHGSNPENIPEATNLNATGLPYQTGDPVNCTTCHDPHNQANRPFLRVELVGLCERCHKDREHSGYGVENSRGNHPVGIEPLDNTGAASPIEVQPYFRVPFPEPYPESGGSLSTKGHWTLGGHLSLGHYGRIECSTCHAFHGNEEDGPVPSLLARYPVNEAANEFCEGCHRGERGDGNPQPPYPNPGGTTTGRTYHPVDDDEANEAGWNVAIADTEDLNAYQWGVYDPDTDLPMMLCTTCHAAHFGMEYSPALVQISEDVTDEYGITTFCEVCHRDPPENHHGYSEGSTVRPDIAQQMLANQDKLGTTYGEPEPDRIYCSYCHRAHNAGYGRNEADFIPILVDKGIGICNNCHVLGVSHFMGDSTLASTYNLPEPSLFRGIWPATGMSSYYEGEAENPATVTCESCHYLSAPSDGGEFLPYRLLAPADEDTEWIPGYPEDYLCTGCHGESPATVGEGVTHPLMEADATRYPVDQSYLQFGETMVTYTPNHSVNCHSCHRAHGAALPGGVYILKMVRGPNIDPAAIQPQIDYTDLCLSCHPR